MSQRGRRRSKKAEEGAAEVSPEAASPAISERDGASGEPSDVAEESATEDVARAGEGAEEPAIEEPAPGPAEETDDAAPADRGETPEAAIPAAALELTAAGDDAEAAFEDDEEGPGLEKATASPASHGHLKTILESLLFVSDKPLPAKVLARIARSRVADVEPLIEQLVVDYRGRGIELVEVAGGFQFRSAASSAPFVRELVAKKPVRLSRAQIESLAILAYRQPMTRPELEEIRGVDCGSALKVLLEKSLIRILGRKDEAGRPLLYGTTPHFLEFFGLASLGDLPTLREYGELTEESRALFQRKMGEQIDTIGDIAIEQHHYTDEEIEALERQARGEPDPSEADEGGMVQQELPVPSDDEGDLAPSAGDGEDDE